MASLLIAGMTLVAAAAAWGGLAWLVLTVPPARPLAVLAAYVFAFAALTPTATLLAWIGLRPRDDQGQLASPIRYIAHAMLFAIIALFGIWLQTLRALTPVVGGLLIGLYVFLELAIQFGTRGSVELPVRR
jgi:hypothetical protein